MPFKILHFCLVLAAICINHETLSQVISDFKCTIPFPMCKKPGVARAEQDIITFSILLDMQDSGLDRWMWQFVAVVFDDNKVLESYRQKKWLTYMHTTSCAATVSLFVEYKYRDPYQKCRLDPDNRRLLRMEIGVRASTRYSKSNLIAVWINRAGSFEKSKSVRYPMVLVKVEEHLRVDYKDMPGHNAYIRPGSHHVFQYCVTVRDTGWSIINFKIGDKPESAYSRSNGTNSTQCPIHPVTTTLGDLHQTLRMSYWEIYGPCNMYINTTGLMLDALSIVDEMQSSKSKANELSTQPMEHVLISVTLSGAAMWMSSTLDYHG